MKLRRKTLAAQVRQLKEQLAAAGRVGRRKLRAQYAAMVDRAEAAEKRLTQYESQISGLRSTIASLTSELDECKRAAAPGAHGAGAGAPKKEGV